METIHNHILYPSDFIDMLRNKRRKRSEETVCHRFTIYLLDYISLAQSGFSLKYRNEITVTPFVKFGDKSFSYHRSAALIAKNITHRRYIADYLFAIIKAGIGTSSKYASNAFRLAAERFCSTEKIASHLNMLHFRKRFADNLLHHRT